MHARSLDFQDVTLQGVVTYRVQDPGLLASRVDFTIDLVSGAYVRQPVEKLELLLSQLAQQHAAGYVAATGVREVLTRGHEEIRNRVAAALAQDESLAAMGLAVVTKLPAGVNQTTLEFKLNFVRPMSAATGEVRGEGRVVHCGRSVATAEGRLLGSDGKVIAHGNTTCMIFRPA